MMVEEPERGSRQVISGKEYYKGGFLSLKFTCILSVVLK